LYASAVRNGIAAYQLREGKEVLPGTYNETNKLPFEPEYDGKVDCENIIISETGKVSLDKCTVNGGEKEYSYGIEEESNVAKVCSIEQQDESKYSVGDVVTCNIGNTPDKFYVIADAELSASTIQILTEKNVHTTEYRQSDNAGTIAFSTTQYWTSTDMIEVYGDYKNDEGEQQNLIYPIVESYVSYLNTKLIGATGKLLLYDQMDILGCSYGDCSSAPQWVYSIEYWLGYSHGEDVTGGVYYTSSGCGLYLESYYTFDSYGVRPVITISTSNIK